MGQTQNSRIAFLCSVLFHGLCLCFLLFFEQGGENSQEKLIEVQWVDLKSLEERDERQVVQQDKDSLNDQVPEQDYRLSQQNQTLAQETKASQNGVFENHHGQGGEGQTLSRRVPSQKSSPNNLSPKEALIKALKPSLLNPRYEQTQGRAEDSSPAFPGSQVSRTDDYLKDVVAGAETLLNTREFVYYSYYNRIKRKLRQHWEPRIRKKILKILKKGRRIAGTQDKTTRLVIVLDEKGALKRIQLKNGSGYQDLDDAAIEAFRAAAPFPHPPVDIVNSLGEVEISWDFVLEG